MPFTHPGAARDPTIALSVVLPVHNEEGNLFTYLARVMKVAKTLGEATEFAEFGEIERRVRARLGAVDERVLDELWS